MNANEVNAWLLANPTKVGRFWGRRNSTAEWTLLTCNPDPERGHNLDVVNYGMLTWEFSGPVLPPDQQPEPMGWAVVRGAEVQAVRRFKPSPTGEADNTVFIPLYP